MPYIKELILKGFKSFAEETKIPFNKGMNVIVGPNGSGKSNIADAICFVLGRLSMKSMRASKISNLIFSAPHSTPASEASVKIIFDNEDKKIPIDTNEVSVERIIRRNGQSIYKINNEVKTRQEVLELLASFGIDPYGFNIILQEEITNVVRMSGEERRKIIEEVSGIAVYEQRKEKSLNELKKTEDKLKVAEAILRDRSAYLKNLEEERKQALKHRELQHLEKRLKASILNKKISEKEKIIQEFKRRTDAKEKEKEKLKQSLSEVESEIREIEEKIKKIEETIEKTTGVQQEKLYEEITELKSKLAGLEVKKDNYLARIEENNLKMENAREEAERLDNEIKTLLKGYDKTAQVEELEKKKKELEKIEKEKEKLYNLKTKYKISLAKFEETRSKFNSLDKELASVIKDIEELEENLIFINKEEYKKNKDKLKKEIENKSKLLKDSEEEVLKLEKEISFLLSEIKNLQEIKSKINSIKDVCPLCQSKITPEHSRKIESECNKKIENAKRKISENKSKISSLNLENLKNELTKLKEKEKNFDIELFKLNSIEEKKEKLKKLNQEKKETENIMLELKRNIQVYEKQINQHKDVPEKYDNLIVEIQELSSRTEKDVDSEIKSKRRELERIKNLIKQMENENSDLQEEITNLEKEIEEINSSLELAEEREREFSEKNKKLIEEKNNLQKELHQKNKTIFSIKSNIDSITEEINNIKVEKARVDAEVENLKNELEPYKTYEIINSSLHVLEEKLEKTKQKLESIGEVNTLALKKYESVKKDYEKILEKVDILRKEKESILNIIDEIDKKKIRTFMKTLKKINEFFKRNFFQLSAKGEAFLKLEDEKNPFSGGLDIIIKVARGKYFDVSSLSGGEKTLIAISLIFAIQEYKPYPFYIFDEIEAALDKRNSERLAALIKKYLQSGQYIIITHNDAIIEEASVLYGVSMQNGKSRIFSLKI